MPKAPPRNNFSFLGSPSQLRFYVAKKYLTLENQEQGNLFFLLAEDSDLPTPGAEPHYRPFKITGGKELHEHTDFEKLLEVHNLNGVWLKDKVNNKGFCSFHIHYQYGAGYSL